MTVWYLRSPIGGGGPLSLWPRRCRGRLSVVGARAAQNVEQRVIAFVARVFVHPVAVVAPPRKLNRERPSVRFWIVDDGRVLQRVVVESRELLRNLQRVAERLAAAVAADAVPVEHVRRLDDERVAVPVRARVAHVAADLRADMWTAVEVEESRLVNHLVAEDDQARRLDDLVAVVVDDRQDRSEDAAGDALIVETAIVVRVGRSVAGPPRGKRTRPFGRLGRLRGHAAVGRIDDERRLIRRRAALEPVRRRWDGAADRPARFH